MSDLDLLGHRHAEIVRTSLLEAEPPPIASLSPAPRSSTLLRRGAIAALAVTIGVVALTTFVSRSGPTGSSAPSESSTSAGLEPLGASLFLPPSIQQGEVVVFPLVLLDGTRMSLTLPPSVAADVAGFVPGGAAGWEMDICCGRTLDVIYGSLADLYGERVPDAVYADGAGHPVNFYAEPDGVDYLVFQIGSWVVRAWDNGPGPGERFTEENRARFASLLRGHETPEGFLVLDPVDPMQVRPTDAPDALLTAGDEDPVASILRGRTCAEEGPVSSNGYAVALGDEPAITVLCSPAHSTNIVIWRTGLTDPELDSVRLEVGVAEPTVEALTTGLVEGLVYLTSENPDQLTVVDLATETVTSSDLPELAPGDALYRLVRRGNVLTFYGQTENAPAVFVVNPETPEAPVLLGEAWFFVPSALEDRIWLAILDPNSPDTIRALSAVREVTIDGTITVSDVEPPGGRWPVAAVLDGLVFQANEILEIWDPATGETVATVPGPFPIATWRNRMATCTECSEVHLVDLDADTERTVPLPDGIATVNGYGGAFSPDGRYVAMSGFNQPGPITSDTVVALVIVDFVSGEAAIVEESWHTMGSSAYIAWSSDSNSVMFISGPDLIRYHLGDGTTDVIDVELTGRVYGLVAG